MDHSKTHSQQGKVVLPAYAENGSVGDTTRIPSSNIGDQTVRWDASTPFPTPRSGEYPLIMPIKPASRKPLSTSIGEFWGKDAANKILVLSVALLVVAGIVFAALASAHYISSGSLFASNNTFSQNPSSGTTPSGTVDFRPSFPTPGGGQGSNTSSQPPVQSTPSLRPTAAPVTPTEDITPTTQQGGSLVVVITSIPQQVKNGNKVNVGVNTNEPDVSVMLSITYNIPPFKYYSNTRNTDGSGNTTLSWRVSVLSGTRGATATVVVLAMDQNGQQTQSDPVVIQIQ